MFDDAMWEVMESKAMVLWEEAKNLATAGAWSSAKSAAEAAAETLWKVGLNLEVIVEKLEDEVERVRRLANEAKEAAEAWGEKAKAEEIKVIERPVAPSPSREEADAAWKAVREKLGLPPMNLDEHL